MLKHYSILIFITALLIGCSIGFFDEKNIVKCGEEEFTSSKQICEDNILKEPCSVGYYNPHRQFCANDIIYEKCGGEDYNLENQICENEIIKTRCEIGNNYHTPATQFCYEDNVYEKCNGESYDVLTQFCSEQDTIIYDKCNDLAYNTEMQFCYEDVVYDKCAIEIYNPTLYFCVDGILISKCGETFYDSNTHFCKDNNIYEKIEIGTYKTVTIGNQTWMAENLRYEIPGSECYDNNPENCELFGMLYDWNTATNICPVGWHLPNDNEWLALAKFVENDSECSNCAGTKLKANRTIWISGNGTDDYGFTALPGGYYRNNSFLEKGEVAGFWSATSGQASGSAHLRFFKYNYLDLGLDGLYIDNSMAYVRCIKD